ATGQVLRRWRHPRTVFGLSVSGSLLATACWDGWWRIFELSGSGSSLREVHHGGGLYAVAFSPKEPSLLATASSDRTVKVWDVSSGRLLWTLPHKDHVTAVDWSHTELLLATGGWDRRFRLWPIGERELRSCKAGGTCEPLAPSHVARHPQLLWSVAFAPSVGVRVAACHGAVGQSPTVVVYELAASGGSSNGGLVRSRRLGRHKDTPLALAFSPDGAKLVSAGMDRKVLVYSAAFGNGDDMPQGDPDDAEERLLWLQDLRDLRQSNSTQAAQLTELAQKLVMLQNRTNGTGSGDGPPKLPHPLSRMVAFA
ncbi:unnamed protein product, partial [Effrenium voratum]